MLISSETMTRAQKGQRSKPGQVFTNEPENFAADDACDHSVLLRP